MKPKSYGIDIDKLRSLVNAYYIIQKYRIATGSQVWAYEHSEEYRNKRGLPPIFLLPDENKLIKELWADVKRGYEGVFGKERIVCKNIEKIGIETPIWINWLKDVKGVGGLTAGVITADLLTREFPYRSSLKRFCGWGTDGGKADEPKKGKKLCYNPQRKAFFWNVGECLIKAKGRYYQYYLEQKKEITKKHPEYLPPKGGWNKVKNSSDKHPARIHKMAVRKTRNLFLSHLWEEMFKIKYPKKKIPKPMHWPNVPMKSDEIIPPIRDV